MSVSIIQDDIISQVAYFGESLKLGSADMIGNIIHAQNVATSNERYSENESPDFFLQDKDNEKTPESIYDMIGYISSNSYTNNFEETKAFKLLQTIKSNAAFPLGENDSYSEITGKRIDARSNWITNAYLVGAKSSQVNTIIYFCSSDLKWKQVDILKSDSTFTSNTEPGFNLSIEQVVGITKRIKDERAAEFNKSELRIEKANQEQKAFNEKFTNLKPDNAKAVIVAELHQNDCGHNDDYYGSKVTKRVILAFSSHTRNLFPEMRKAALNFEPTEHLNTADKKAEHRENYSMGKGTYLTEGSAYSGWQIRKETIYNDNSINKAELLDIDYSNTKAKKISKAKIEKKKIEKSEVAITPIQELQIEASAIIETKITNTPDSKIKHSNSNTTENSIQKKVSIFNLAKGTITINQTNNTISLKTSSTIKRTQVNLLNDSGLSYDEGDQLWVGSISDEAMVAARGVVIDSRCGVL